MLNSHVAVKYDNEISQVATYETNKADGCGPDLPDIYGLGSMTKNDAVIMLREGKRCMAFLGKGGYHIHWSEGTRLLLLQESPAGHLVIPCDSFEGAESERYQAFITDSFQKRDKSPSQDNPLS